VFRAVIWTLRRRRYAALAAGGLVFALVCVGMGTFEIHRYQEKVHGNNALRSNAGAPVAALTTSLVPVTGANASSDAIRYRHVRATGRYLPADQQYLANQSQGGRQGFYVITPLRTDQAVLLVVRGFIAATSGLTRPASVPAAPAGRVTITGWLQTPQTSDDQFGRLGHGEIMSINAGQQAARLGSAVYQASLTLTARQPGTSGLSLVPLPDLGNPTGGAADWQLLSYVIQWYAFAVLALLLPFFISRAEVREARRRFLGIDAEARQLDAAQAGSVGGDHEASGAELVARRRGELARRAAVAERVERAARLADRYGRSLGLDVDDALAAAPADATPVATGPVVRDSSTAVHRSEDEYHASYNDYLWQLALADGGLPELFEKGEPKRIEQVPEGGDSSTPDPGGPVP
jgi:cytochrome oxidase assembly protein ShyY1